jgi:hypothetical protein
MTSHLTLKRKGFSNGYIIDKRVTGASRKSVRPIFHPSKSFRQSEYSNQTFKVDQPKSNGKVDVEHLQGVGSDGSGGEQLDSVR